MVRIDSPEDFSKTGNRMIRLSHLEPGDSLAINDRYKTICLLKWRHTDEFLTVMMLPGDSAVIAALETVKTERVH